MTTITPGEAWTLRWDGKELARAVVAQVHEGFVVAWPLTDATHPAYAPSLLVDDEHQPLGTAVWPTRPTGIGNHLLGSRIGTLLDEETVEILTDQMEDPEAELTILPLGVAPYDSEADERLLDEWTEYCFHTGAPERQRWLDTTHLDSSRSVAAALGLDVVQTRDYWDGVSPVTEAQVETLARETGISAEQLTRDDPYAGVVQRLASPEFKTAVEDRIQATGLGEEQVRTAARQEFALAARDDSPTRVDDKLRDALSRVGEPGQ
ncbi:hypothetical protein [Actinomyces bowdenii]|uniref:Uncharacterized protein n=1 Tax=Actinomyces bowdenii TaxID=131109 RepID=A0A3P1URD0_9ACTO|nr:hypothetical protein [Actinomyces bowdenii]RRD24454.1 hypothetical protein EII10_11370 [Actinomyces bowdenii]